MLPNREGRFKAAILDHGVAETGPNHLATFICQYQLVAELANGEWAGVGEDLQISGYHYLEKKDGSINQVTVDALKAAFGWDGRDPFWLQDAEMGERVVQVKLAFEQYDGKQRIKVQYVDAEDAVPGGVPKSDDASRRSINARLGAKFRAMAGGSPAPAPRPAAPRPVPARPPAPAATVEQSAPQATMETAWAEFVRHCNGEWSQDRVEAEWFAVLGELFGGKQPDELSPTDWGVMLAEGPKHITPF